VITAVEAEFSEWLPAMKPCAGYAQLFKTSCFVNV